MRSRNWSRMLAERSGGSWSKTLFVGGIGGVFVQLGIRIPVVKSAFLGPMLWSKNDVTQQICRPKTKLGYSDMKSRILAAALFNWSASAFAKLPEAAGSAFNHIYYAIGVFFAFGLASIFLSSILARKFAPGSRDLRQLVIVFVTVIGCGIGGFVATKAVR
ncbi:hypothetical protein [Nitrogeniibacter mangrovi]|uniref:hypothetical protein n=1 Tax=Nitrogeniibacter mangrovi TaxID=2016596 RepID=UPI001E641478|nr:hypothetical protein [Nitrogeniibacter mangrovi]